MESAIVLDAEDVKKIISAYLGVPKENVIKSQYSYTVKGITGEQVEKLQYLELEVNHG